MQNYKDDDLIGGPDFVRMLVGYHSMCSKIEYLKSPPTDNPPRAIRFAQIMAFCEAFEIPKDLPLLVSGDFLLQQLIKIDHSTAVAKALELFLGDDYSHFSNVDAALLPADLSFTFRELYQLRKDIDSVTFNGVDNHLLRLVAITLRAKQEAKNSLQDISDKIDDFLGYLFVPDRRTISINELKEKHSWPDEDLIYIDAEWY